MVHGPGPQRWSMDRVHRGGPWTGGPCFVYVPQRFIFTLNPNVTMGYRKHGFRLNKDYINCK